MTFWKSSPPCQFDANFETRLNVVVLLHVEVVVVLDAVQREHARLDQLAVRVQFTVKLGRGNICHNLIFYISVLGNLEVVVFGGVGKGVDDGLADVRVEGVLGGSC